MQNLFNIEMYYKVVPTAPKTKREAYEALKSFIAGYIDGPLTVWLPKEYEVYQNALIQNFHEGYLSGKFGPDEYARRERDIIHKAVNVLFQ